MRQSRALRNARGCASICQSFAGFAQEQPMRKLRFVPFAPDLDPARVVMIDGYAPGFRMISHWPGHGTAPPLRHDLTTGSAFLYSDMSEAARTRLVGEFSIVTNNHYDTDGALSLFTMLRPDIASRHRDLMLRAARLGDLAIWGGADALALDLSITSDLESFMPFSTPPYDTQRLGNLARAYERVFERMESLLAEPFSLRSLWERRHRQVLADVTRVERGEGIAVAKYPDDDLAVVETDRPITIVGSRLAAGDLFRVLLVHPGEGGNRYRFCFRGESWWDVVSVRPQPRKHLAGLAARLNTLEGRAEQRWWASAPDWTVPELGFGAPVEFRHQAARFDPQTARDPSSRLPTEVVVQELRNALRTAKTFEPIASSVQPVE
jgi:hypothetical protein